MKVKLRVKLNTKYLSGEIFKEVLIFIIKFKQGYNIFPTRIVKKVFIREAFKDNSPSESNRKEKEFLERCNDLVTDEKRLQMVATDIIVEYFDDKQEDFDRQDIRFQLKENIHSINKKVKFDVHRTK